MAKTVSGRPRRPPGLGTGAAAKGSRAPSAQTRAGAAVRTGRLAGLFVTARRRGKHLCGRDRPAAAGDLDRANHQEL